MKKFLNWFKNSTKIKRWMFVILIGIVLTCFGFSKILISERLELKDLIIIISTFVAGFICFGDFRNFVFQELLGVRY